MKPQETSEERKKKKTETETEYKKNPARKKLYQINKNNFLHYNKPQLS